MNEIKHVLIYLRLSRDEEKLGIEKALENHRITLTKLCKENNWSYVTLEEIASSSTIEHRPKMIELLKRVNSNEFDAVVVKAVDRLSRDEYDSSDIKRIFYDTGTFIVTPGKTYDPTKDEDSLLWGIQSLVAAQEYKQIKKRMQDGKDARVLQGLWTDGFTPLGYSKNKETRKLEIEPEEAKTIEYIFNSIIEGKTVSETVTHLNAIGVRTRKKCKFEYGAITRIVNNEVYKGNIVYNKTMVDKKRTSISKEGRIKYGSKPRPRTEWIHVPNTHEAIIDEVRWSKAVKLVNEYKFSKPRAKNRIYPTTKLILCGNCGRTHSIEWKEKVSRYYLTTCRGCKNRTYQYLPLLKQIKLEVMKYQEDVLDLIADVGINFDTDTYDFEKERLETNILKARKALSRIEILFEEEEIEIEQYRFRKSERKKEITELTYLLDNLKAEDPTEKLATLEEIKANANVLSEKWQMLDGEGLNDEEVNRLLHFIIDKILWTYTKGSTEPELKIVYKQ